MRAITLVCFLAIVGAGRAAWADELCVCPARPGVGEQCPVHHCAAVQCPGRQDGCKSCSAQACPSAAYLPPAGGAAGKDEIRLIEIEVRLPKPLGFGVRIEVSARPKAQPAEESEHKSHRDLLAPRNVLTRRV